MGRGWWFAIVIAFQVVAAVGPVGGARAGLDVTAPELVSFSVRPTSLDTASASRTITFTARITDGGSGVSGAGKVSYVRFVGPSGQQFIEAVFAVPQLVLGTANDGIYLSSTTLPQYAEKGTWTVREFVLFDREGNRRDLTAADLAASGFPTTFTQTGAGDTTPPDLVTFTFSPSSVDPSFGTGVVTVTAGLRDAISGVARWWPLSEVQFSSPSGTETLTVTFSEAERVSGDALDGVYRSQATLPQNAEAGVWTVRHVRLYDEVRNIGVLNSFDLAARDLPWSLTVAVSPPAVPGPAMGFVDPATGQWYLRNGDGIVSSFYFGNPGDYPFMGDWDGDGTDTPGLYRQSDGYVYLRNSNTQGIADIRFFFGNPGDVPIAGDFNGDGFDTVSIYRPSNQTFYIINELGKNNGGLGAAEFFYVFGNPGDKPFVGDFDGDGVATVGLHRESTGLVYFRNTHTQGIADNQFIFGDPGDRLVAGDWTGDGVDTPALFRPSNTTMYFRYTNTQGNADAQFTFGSPTWLPVAGVFGLG